MIIYYNMQYSWSAYCQSLKIIIFKVEINFKQKLLQSKPKCLMPNYYVSPNISCSSFEKIL